MADSPPDERDDPEWRDERARQIRGHRRDYESRPTIVTVFERLGYDLYNSQDMERLAENLRFAERSRKRTERFESNKLGWVISLIFIFLGSAVTAFLQWIATKVPGIK